MYSGVHLFSRPFHKGEFYKSPTNTKWYQIIGGNVCNDANLVVDKGGF
jgi:hypothetical protein